MFLLLPLAALSLGACSSSNGAKHKKPEPEIVVKYSDAIKKDQKFSEWFDKVDLIPLDTTGNFLIGGIRQIIMGTDCIFVLDKRHSVYIFNKQGQAIIDRRGQGANEYLNIRGIDLASDSLLCLLTFPPKLMYFTPDGRFVKEAKLDIQGNEAALLPDGKVALYADNIGSTKDTPASLLEICDLASGACQGYVPGYTCLPGLSLPVFQCSRTLTKTSGGQYLFSQPLSNDIYVIGNDGTVSVRYRIDFEGKNPPEDLPGTFSDVHSRVEFIKKNFPVYGFNNCWENNAFFNIQFYMGDEAQSLLHDKKQQTWYSGGIREDFTGLVPWLIEATDRHWAGYWTADDIAGAVSYLEATGKPLDEFPLFEKLAKYAQEKENPIIGLYHFKGN